MIILTLLLEREHGFSSFITQRCITEDKSLRRVFRFKKFLSRATQRGLELFDIAPRSFRVKRTCTITGQPEKPCEISKCVDRFGNSIEKF